MKIKKIILDDYFKLFVKREGKVVLGKNFSNLWLLTGVLTATFLAIAFSNASMSYLSEKMNDPFIKWVDIKNSFGEGDFVGLEAALNDFDNQEQFGYNSYQSDYYFSFMFFGQEERMLQYFQCRFFEDFQTDLVRAILSKDNVIDDCCIKDLDSLSPETVGIVITNDALAKLGYKETPPYIDLCRYSEGADSLGINLYEGLFARVPLPILAVVKRLPSSVDIISTKYFFEQENNDNTYPFNLSKRTYSESLRYFVPASADREAFIEDLTTLGKDLSSITTEIDEYSFYKPELVCYQDGEFISLVGSLFQPMVPSEVSEISNQIDEKWSASGVTRIFDYDFSPYEVAEKSYLSVYFDNLNHIRDFETFVKENYHVKIDMSQINSKENFNAVSIMANILSWAIIVFAIICIILFIVNLLKSYFQKVKHNLGTYKAFGVSNERLISVYVLIVGATILAAIIISLAITFTTQEFLIIVGIMKEGTYSYLSLWSIKTAISVVIILIASIYTVQSVMSKLLRQTPGDLIYDRQ